MFTSICTSTFSATLSTGQAMAPRLIGYLPVTVATLLVLRYLLRRRGKRLPPGPKGRFLVGNLSDLPKDEAEKAKTYVKWREDYGAYLVIHYRLLF